MKINREKQEKNSQQLLTGTSSIKSYQKIEAIKLALCHPHSQYIVFSSNIKKLSWIIVKDPVQNNQPIFHFYCQTLKRRFLSAQKQPNNIGCNYLISKNEKPQKDSEVVGKLRGNFRNTDFIIYDSGQNPKKKTGRKRKQFASIEFHQQSIFSQNREQKVEIIVPQVRQVNQQFDICPKYLPKQFIPYEEKQNLLNQQSEKNSPDVIKIIELVEQKDKKSQQNSTISNLMSNLINKGLNTKLKLKQSSENQSIFQFKTRGKNTFCLKFSYPFNIVQSFCIALAFIEKGSE